MNRGILALFLTLALTGVAAAQATPLVDTDVSGDQPASSHPAPYAKLAEDLGTPDLVSSQGPKDKSLLKLDFVGSGQKDDDWVKKTSISIAKVAAADTQLATRAIIAKFKAGLQAQKHATITAFDESPVVPLHAYFSYTTSDGVAEQGVAYSPASGFVSVIEVSYKHGFVHGQSDGDLLKAVVARAH